MKSGIVCLIGRPNVGKSTLLNAIIGHKVSITSPKPQTTRFAIQALYENEEGQILFVDTPGVYGKSEDKLAKLVNKNTQNAAEGTIDVVIYVVDHTRERDYEENKSLGIVRKIDAKRILVINKTDIKKPTHIIQYKFLENEFDTVLEISALTRKNTNLLIQAIFSFLPEREKLIEAESLSHPGLNMDSKTFTAEIIREKAYLFLRREVPYSLTAVVDEIVNRDNGVLYIRGRILTNDDRYKVMIIGSRGRMIKEISMAVRKEIETASNKKVFIELTVETDPHWVESFG